MKHFYLLLLLLGFLGIGRVTATHIVGGEFELRYLNDFNYRLSLNLYFDLVNGNPEAEDEEILVHIYAKRDNRLIQAIVLPQVSQEDLVYQNPECAIGDLQTRLLVYSRDLQLSPDDYDEIEGYYVVWERCCRNETISNILAPGDAGTTFYLEFPAVVRNGLRFVNSSPSFEPPPADYLCLDTFFNFNFSATDADGDVLQYRLVSPLNGNSTAQEPAPDPQPAPYDPIIWLPGFSATRAIPSDIGTPGEFQIDVNTGEITVSPNALGLFVFGVICEEYRNGIKIGEVRRDFQVKVLECEINQDPSIAAETPEGINYQEGDTIELSLADNRLCFDFLLRDPDASEQVNLSVLGVNFTPRSNLLRQTTGQINGVSDVLRIPLCWPDCLFSERDANGNLIPFIFDVIVADDGCPFAGSDIIRVRLISEPIENQPPTVSVDLSVATANNSTSFIVGETLEFDVFAQDPDPNVISLRIAGEGFEPAELGMQFQNKEGLAPLQSRFVWQPDCRYVLEEQNLYRVYFISEDRINCVAGSDTVAVDIILNDIPIDLSVFEPYNVFTPNNDGKNDVFALDNLPDENCRFAFESIIIYNRWGNEVFRSEDRNFTWDGGELPAGVYFYHIDYRKQQYKGNISLIR